MKRNWLTLLAQLAAAAGIGTAVLTGRNYLLKQKQVEADLRRRNLELDLLNRACQVFSSSLDLPYVLNTVLAEMRSLLGISATSFWLVIPETGELVCQHATGPGSKEIRGFRLAPGQGVTGWVAQSGESALVPDTWADSHHFRGTEAYTGQAFRSMLSIPMRTKEGVIGVLNLVDTAPGRFTANDMRMLEPLVGSAAIAIENAHLHTAMQTELVERRRAEAALRRLNEELERRIDERTRSLLSEIADRKQIEQFLRESEARFRRVVTSISDHAYMTEITKQGERINRYLSPNVEALTGFPPDRLLADWHFWAASVIHPEDRGMAAAHAQRLAQGQSGEIEYRLVRADNRVIWVRDRARVEREDDSLIVYGLVSDITERKEIEEQASEIKLMRELENLRSELISNVSHELRTPLGLIKATATTLLAEDVEFDRETKRMLLQGIDEESDRLERIVSNLLELSRLEQHRFHLERAPVNINQLSLEVLQTQQRQYAPRSGFPQHRFVHDFPTEPIIVRVDAKRLEQVLRNLLSNAIKYSPNGGTITLKGQVQTDQLIVRVSDEGIGIALPDQTKIFERFYRVDNEVTRQASGTGLGLAISRGIVEAHGGCLNVESEEGAGSTFVISLPCMGDQDEQR